MATIIDAGGWKADSVARLKKRYGDVQIHSFEPNPRLESYYKTLTNHTLHKKAVWIKDEMLAFYFGKREIGRSGSIIHGKKNTTENKVQVEAIDFDKWIRCTFTKDEKLILKMDIEGAEYEVLQHMIDGGSIEYIDTLLVEWHWNRIPGGSLEKQLQLIKQIKLPIALWA